MMHKMQLKLWQWTIQLSGHSMIETNWKTGREWEGGGGVRHGKSFNYTCRGTIRQPLFFNGMPWFANNYDAERNLSTACSLSCKALSTNFKIRSYDHPSLEEVQARSHGKTTLELNRLSTVVLISPQPDLLPDYFVWWWEYFVWC